jgi:hypothetical protein
VIFDTILQKRFPDTPEFSQLGLLWTEWRSCVAGRSRAELEHDAHVLISLQEAMRLPGSSGAPEEYWKPWSIANSRYVVWPWPDPLTALREGTPLRTPQDEALDDVARTLMLQSYRVPAAEVLLLHALLVREAINSAHIFSDAQVQIGKRAKDVVGAVGPSPLTLAGAWAAYDVGPAVIAFAVTPRPWQVLAGLAVYLLARIRSTSRRNSAQDRASGALDAMVTTCRLARWGNSAAGAGAPVEVVLRAMEAAHAHGALWPGPAYQLAHRLATAGPTDWIGIGTPLPTPAPVVRTAARALPRGD